MVGIWACCVLSIVGNLLFAVGDSVAVLAVGRVFAGLAFGLAAVFVPAYARAVGGVKMVGLFGAGLTLGVAAALFLGSVLEGAGRQLASRLLHHRRARCDRAADPAQRTSGDSPNRVGGRGAGPRGPHQSGLVAGAAARDHHPHHPPDRRRLARAFPDHRLRHLRGRGGGARLRDVRALGCDARHRRPDDRRRRQSRAVGDRGPRSRGGRARPARGRGLHPRGGDLPRPDGGRPLPSLPALLRRGRARPSGPSDRQPRSDAGRDRGLPDPRDPGVRRGTGQRRRGSRLRRAGGVHRADAGAERPAPRAAAGGDDPEVSATSAGPG